MRELDPKCKPPKIQYIETLRIHCKFRKFTINTLIRHDSLKPSLICLRTSQFTSLCKIYIYREREYYGIPGYKEGYFGIPFLLWFFLTCPPVSGKPRTLACPKYPWGENITTLKTIGILPKKFSRVAGSGA